MEGREFLSQSKGELIEKLKADLGVEQATLYNWMKFLNFQLHKEGSESWISTFELDHLRQLKQWIEENGSKEGYPLPKGALVATVDNSSMQQTAEKLEGEEIPIDPFAPLRRSAQAMAAGELIATELLKAEYLNNPDTLDPEFKAQIERVRGVTGPKPVDPMAYAKQLIKRMAS